MRNYFTLDGTDSRNFGIFISGRGTFDSPARSMNFIQVPGRDGDLIGMSTRLQNGTLTYADSFIYEDFDERLAAFRAFALSVTGYRRLMDSYHPNEFRLVTYAGPLTVNTTPRNNAGKFTISFNCKPQRYLISGETPVDTNASITLINPTLFDSQPLFRVFGTGVLSVGSINITIASHGNPYIDIDCSIGRAFYGATPLDNKVTLNTIDYPVLKPGANNILLGSGITRAIITPRWWTV